MKAVKAEATRIANGDPVTPELHQHAAERKVLLKEVPADLRQQGRREYTQSEASLKRGQ
ncbi:hypothetical protein [Streptomyces sp. NBC_01500]|uniref:hypothetical protein n=1 Tax=Streptomyces sp. NBC_01500 TaxID=2903886 RepID=UPI0022599408|nr:hypothetical protein [Streptomyces sp. NBC_01500]MCX4552268.1 hypothetical protein [Streptomyces sp. NBC_01500]